MSISIGAETLGDILMWSHSAREDMRYLVQKYPNGYEGTESRKPECEKTQFEASDTSLLDQGQRHLVST